MNKDLPIVAIIGRPNVGKSSLFNRLIGEPRAIVAKEAGTTRDRVEGIMHHGNRQAWLVDTAGVLTVAEQSGEAVNLHSDIQAQVDEVKELAATVVVVIDGSGPVTLLDQQVAKSALKTGKPVLLAVNKIDKRGAKVADEVKKLGIKIIVPTSAEHKQGIEDLTTAIFKATPKGFIKAETHPTLALVGRPNVGKSSLFNALSGEAKAIVSDIAGTTRDLNQTTVGSGKNTLNLIDTGGIRRPGQRFGIEHFSYLRTLWAINQADVVGVVMDATEPAVNLDQRITGAVKEAGKGLFIIVNKWDLIEDPETTQVALELILKRELAFVPWAPVVLTSAVGKRNLKKLTEMTQMILANRKTSLKTTELNEILQTAIAHHPPAGLKGRQPKLKYVTQTGTEPPEFTFFGHNLGYLHWSYKRYLESQLRHHSDFTGTPITLRFKVEEKG